MPRSTDVRGVLRDEGFEQILDVPAVPESTHGTTHGQGAAQVVPDQNGRRWRLRAFDTDFDLVLPTWRRVGLTRVYSFGWGLVDGAEEGAVLLAQASGTPAELVECRDRLSARLATAGFDTIHAVHLAFPQGWLRLAGAPEDPSRPRRVRGLRATRSAHA